MSWFAYLVGEYWPLLAIILVFATLILLFTNDWRPRP